MDQADPCIAQEQVDAAHAALGVVMNTNLAGTSRARVHYSYTYNLAFWNAVFDAGK